MPVHSVGGQRWARSGENSAGDPMFSRVYGGEGSTDYESMTKEELQGLLKHMALPTSGNKDELIARLRDEECLARSRPRAPAAEALGARQPGGGATRRKRGLGPLPPALSLPFWKLR